MTETRRITIEDARRVGDEIGIDWSRFGLEQFRSGMESSSNTGRMTPRPTSPATTRS
jgi:hypothetical protein